ncbi:type I secretion C-terminal target domain-containing protein, partial [Kiloniella majae]|uniref:type I secretion C-terminal target domain-containing protein n=1 Tax=Kiloniella majae TaxID=1938558 RepID=UPI000F787576
DTSDDIVSATVTVTDFVVGDQLGLTGSYTLPAGITLNYNSATGVLTLSGAASAADYEAVLENITYSSTSDNPDLNGANTTRTIELSVSDGSDDSNVITQTIDIKAVNEVIIGDDNANTLSATSDGGASLSGLLGDDVLYGAAGDDILLGGGDDDLLTGYAGADVLTGGSGSDSFIFTDANSVDRITDFNLAEGDVLNISDLIDYSDGTGDLISDYLSVESDADGATISISSDGGNTYTNVAVLDNVSSGDTLRVILDQAEENIFVV